MTSFTADGTKQYALLSSSESYNALLTDDYWCFGFCV